MASASGRTSVTFALVILLVLCVWCVIAEDVYTHQFAVHVRGGRSTADRLAEKYGYANHGQIGSLDDHYLFSHQRVSKRSSYPSSGSHTDLADEPEVEWFEQQVSRTRVKRSGRSIFTDPLWSKQWYLDGNATDNSIISASMNVQKAWELGYTGKGVVITIMDDGLEHNHTDIKSNYDPAASYDYVSRDSDPMPRYIANEEINMHGTRCAGEIVMQPNNSMCGVGVAYNASIGGIRMLDWGEITDEMEASSMSTNQQHIDIYSASWGPDDGGFTLEGPATLAKMALEKGINQGRGGKGSIFVWASGNGGFDFDDCNADGYANSIYTLVVSSTTENQDKPFYSEHCSASLASTFSSGSRTQKKVVSTDLHNQCVDDFTGTSASAPIAAGIVALALEANGNLTWRDVQYLVVVTAKRHQLVGEWITNGAGYDVSHWFGFGLMDAGAMVERAQSWENLPSQYVCNHFADTTDQYNGFFASFNLFETQRGDFSTSIEVERCEDPMSGGAIQYLEHVQVTLKLSAKRRGNLVVKLTSPSGTNSTLLRRRTKDRSRWGLNRWTLMSVHFWGENPIGKWKLHVGDGSENRLRVQTARLTLRGTTDLPESLRPTENPSDPAEEAPETIVLEPSSPQREQDTVVMSGSPIVVSASRQRESRAISESSSSWDSSWWWSSSDWESFIECHDECLYGCSGTGPTNCYKCRHYKDRNTLACVASCPTGQFTPVELHIRCGKCNGHCKTCSGPSKFDCLSCNEGQYLSDNNQCVGDCGHGYYPDPFFKMCRQCSPLCTKCVGNENQCTECVHGAVLRGSQCITRCMESEYLEGNQCRKCDFSCYSCNGGTANDCTGCFDDYVHKDMQCVSASQCGQGFYIANSFDANARQCLRCHSTCKDCQGPSFTDCVMCHLGSFLVGGACLQTCENGKYLDRQGNCRQCSAGCRVCSNDTYCIQCDASKVLTYGVGDHKGDSFCKEGCEDGKYSMEGECYSCHATCETCSGGGIMDCTRCKQTDPSIPKYLLEGACVHYCPSGYFKYPLTMTCEMCDETCKTCSGFRADDCLTCEQGLVLDGNMECVEPNPLECDADNCDVCVQGNSNICKTCMQGWYLLGTGCVQSCPDGQFISIASGRCELCHPSCKTCMGNGDVCTSCDSQYFLDEFDNLCLTQCPDDTFVRIIDKHCQLCDDACASCNGPGNANCTVCYGMDEFLSGSECLKKCPDGQYGDEYTGTCRSCHPSCVTCAGPGDHECNTCHDQFTLELGFCTSSCSDNSYTDADGHCQGCHSSCQTCTGGGSDNCLSCNYYNFLDLPHHRCVTDCPQRFYPDYESNVCRECDPSCKTCLNSGPEDCIECDDNTYMLLRNGQTCVETCPEGFYESAELGFKDCRQCSVECRDCHGTYLNCISCHDGTYLFQGRCFSTCPSGYEEEDFTNHCILRDRICPLHCAECDDWGDCTSCEGDGDYVEYFGECVAKEDMICEKNEFIANFGSDGSADCQPCDKSCDTCLGSANTDCVSCAVGFRFHGSRCVSECVSGTYHDETLGECYECHPTCGSCDKGSPLDCTSCLHGMHLSGPDNHGTCEFGCPEGKYPTDDGQCESCKEGACFSCNGGEVSDCLTCKLGFLKIVNGSCLKICPAKTYEYVLEDATVGNECRACHISCESCVGPGPRECSSCDSLMVHLGGQCLWDCDEGYYPDGEGRCQRCNEICQTCIGPQHTDCMSCRVGQFLQDQVCVDTCETGYYAQLSDIPMCLECDPACKNCRDYGPFDCTECHPNYELQDGICYNRCGNKHFYERKSKTCGKCSPACNECYGTGDDQCIDCQGNLKLEKIDRNHTRCIPCCKDADEGDECCDTCKPESHKCSRAQVHREAPKGGMKINHVGTIVFSVMLVIVVFFLVFGLLQARSHGKLCWSHKYHKVPSYSFNNKDKHVTLGKPEDDYYEEDIYGDVSDEEEEDLEEPDTFQTIGGGYRSQDKNGVIDHL